MFTVEFKVDTIRLYNGSQRWTAVTDIAELIPVVPGLVEHFKPRLKYLLIDENAYSDTELASLNNLVAAVFRFEQADSPATIDRRPHKSVNRLAN